MGAYFSLFRLGGGGGGRGSLAQATVDNRIPPRHKMKEPLHKKGNPQIPNIRQGRGGGVVAKIAVPVLGVSSGKEEEERCHQNKKGSPPPPPPPLPLFLVKEPPRLPRRRASDVGPLGTETMPILASELPSSRGVLKVGGLQGLETFEAQIPLRAGKAHFPITHQAQTHRPMLNGFSILELALLFFVLSSNSCYPAATVACCIHAVCVCVYMYVYVYVYVYVYIYIYILIYLSLYSYLYVFISKKLCVCVRGLVEEV